LVYTILHTHYTHLLSHFFGLHYFTYSLHTLIVTFLWFTLFTHSIFTVFLHFITNLMFNSERELR